jgi:hypothetical protein
MEPLSRAFDLVGLRIAAEEIPACGGGAAKGVVNRSP